MSSPFANEEVRTYVRDSESDISQLKTRVKELEEEAEYHKERARHWSSEAIHENAEKHRLEAENAELLDLLRCIKSWDVDQYLLLPIHLRSRIQAAIEDDEGEA